MKASKKTAVRTLRSLSFLDYAKQVVGDKRAKHIADSFGYYSELVIMNAYDAIRLMRILDTNTKSNTFYGMAGGLSQIISGLETEIRKYPNAEIRMKTEVVDVFTVDASPSDTLPSDTSPTDTLPSDTFESRRGLMKCIFVDGDSVFTQQCVFALPKPALEKLAMFQSLKPELNQVSCGSLCRIYSQFRPSDAKWMKGLNKITTNNDLRMIIPIDSAKGIVMISYTDNRYADAWNTLHKQDVAKGSDNSAVDTRIAKLIRETLHVDIPKPIKTKVFYWSCGVGYWNVGANSRLVAKRMIRPFGAKRIFVCGEHFSGTHQQWMEGALETSQTVVRALLS